MIIYFLYHKSSALRCFCMWSISGFHQDVSRSKVPYVLADGVVCNNFATVCIQTISVIRYGFVANIEGKALMIGGYSPECIGSFGTQECIVIHIHIFSGNNRSVFSVCAAVHIKVVADAFTEFNVTVGSVSAVCISRSGNGVAVIVE